MVFFTIQAQHIAPDLRVAIRISGSHQYIQTNIFSRRHAIFFRCDSDHLYLLRQDRELFDHIRRDRRIENTVPDVEPYLVLAHSPGLGHELENVFQFCGSGNDLYTLHGGYRTRAPDRQFFGHIVFREIKSNNNGNGFSRGDGGNLYISRNLRFCALREYIHFDVYSPVPV